MAHQSAQPVFLLVRRSGATSQAFPLGRGIVTVGRGPDNDVVIDDVGVSRCHARLTWQGSQWLLEDLNSRNGTFVNGQRVAGPTWLRQGDQIGFGPDTAFSLETAPAASAHGLSSAPMSVARCTGRPRWLWGLLSVALIAFVILAAGLLSLYRLRRAQAELEPARALALHTRRGPLGVLLQAPPALVPAQPDAAEHHRQQQQQQLLHLVDINQLLLPLPFLHRIYSTKVNKPSKYFHVFFL